MKAIELVFHLGVVRSLKICEHNKFLFIIQSTISNNHFLYLFVLFSRVPIHGWHSNLRQFRAQRSDNGASVDSKEYIRFRRRPEQSNNTWTQFRRSERSLAYLITVEQRYPPQIFQEISEIQIISLTSIKNDLRAGLFQQVIIQSGTGYCSLGYWDKQVAASIAKELAKVLNCSTESSEEMLSCFMGLDASEFALGAEALYVSQVPAWL